MVVADKARIWTNRKHTTGPRDPSRWPTAVEGSTVRTVVEMSESITEASEIVVGAPLSRETIRRIETGYLVCCRANQCQWEGVFPSTKLARQAANTHLYRRRREQDPIHVGSCGASLVELDGDRARAQGDTHHVYIGSIGPREPLAFEDDFGMWFPRSTDDVSDLVSRGDKIELPGRQGTREGKVASVVETRSIAIPTWSVSYAPVGTDLSRSDWDARFKNELIAQDGEVYCRYGEEFLGHPVLKVVGVTDHQSNIGEFGGGTA